MKTEERQRARQLRRDEGLPIKEIARRVGLSVASVSVWVRDIELTDEQHARLRAKNPAYNQQLSGRRIGVANRRVEWVTYQARGRETARGGDLLHLAGCMLDWAEGSKGRNQLRFSNSDPEMIRFFVRFLQECLGVKRTRFGSPATSSSTISLGSGKSNVSGSRLPASRHRACVVRL